MPYVDARTVVLCPDCAGDWLLFRTRPTDQLAPGAFLCPACSWTFPLAYETPAGMPAPDQETIRA